MISFLVGFLITVKFCAPRQVCGSAMKAQKLTPSTAGFFLGYLDEMLGKSSLL